MKSLFTARGRTGSKTRNAIAVGAVGGTAIFAILLAFAQMIISPTARAAIPPLAGEQNLGSYYGAYASIGGLLVLPLAVLTGVAIGHAPSTTHGRAMPWLMAAITAASALLMITRSPTRRSQ